ncbi:LysE/ArgO family amino acid transporter [Ornithinimicrobium pekingense]|uniref:Transporter n=1 Tax=Ornithinimicrobium pekingense TaxID=384677 RepID=A0ABQ2F4M2_9MICO|nr:LysE family transporter [Ornithinimicrobium pekingense]GGK61504.1 putative transporter [Ornithinimicrobium pekingense]
MTPLALVLTGMLTGLGLIVAIGAQNAFLLRQGLRRQQVGPLVLFCILADAALIGLAVLGIGAVVTTWPSFLTVARWGGGLFVIGYGMHAARRALHPGETLEATGAGRAGSAARALGTMAALTLLNPHVYLDVVLLGTIANSHGGQGRWWFYAGIVTGSAVWFTALGLGSRRLAPFFARPRSWQALDAGIAVVMVSIGVGLISGG